MSFRRPIVIGTRSSQLALWQSNHVKDLLAVHVAASADISLLHITTAGDRTQQSGVPLPLIGGKGLFTAELEEALSNRQIDIAVHSLKDLPTEMAAAFSIGAVLPRASAWDVLVSRDNCTFAELPAGARVGTSSMRRLAQLKRMRADLVFEPIRGNVDTRISKVRGEHAPFVATVLAEAGITRIGRAGEITQRFDRSQMLPAPGQGAMAVQCRADDSELLELLRSLDDMPTRSATTAERAFLAGLGGGCNTPVAAFASIVDGTLRLAGRIIRPDGGRCVEVEIAGPPDQADRLGRELAVRAMSAGAAELLSCG